MKGDILSHSSLVLSNMTFPGVRASRENTSDSPEVGAWTDIGVPILALLLTGNATLGKSLPLSEPQFLYLKNT